MAFSSNIYRFFIDPLLAGMRKEISRHISGGSSLVEIGCGTGAQAILMMKQLNRYLGIDLNQAMAECTGRRLSNFRKDGRNIEVCHLDARYLDSVADKAFDYSLSTLALHEMKPENRMAVLREMLRISGTAVITDYRFPLPRNSAGFAVRVIERIAGGSHFRGFREYMTKGGLEPILADAGLQILERCTLLSGTCETMICR